MFTSPFVETWAVAPAADWPVQGIDVSVYQGQMDWAKAKPLITFAHIRAGYGNNTTDAQFLRNVNECVRLHIPYGLYWYMKPDKSWQTTAASFAAAFNSYGGDLPPMFDVENNGGLGKAALESWLAKCCTAFESETGVDIGIYTSPGFWDANMPLTNWAKNRRLWVAHWTTAPAPLLPAEWTDIANPRTWTFWQHSADGNGKGAQYGAQSAAIDLDRYNGTLAQFNQTFGLNVQPPARVPLFQVRVTAAVLMNVRAQPTTAGADIGDLYRNSVLPVYGEYGDWYDVGAGWVAKQYTVKL